MTAITRPDWHTYFMSFAILASERGTCLRRKVGAVLVQNNHTIATGYNGSPPGQPHCIDVGCKMNDGRCIRSIHAEMNAILQAAKYGHSTLGATLYTTHRPCDACANNIAGCGIVSVYYIDGDDDSWGMDVLRDSNIRLCKVTL